MLHVKLSRIKKGIGSRVNLLLRKGSRVNLLLHRFFPVVTSLIHKESHKLPTMSLFDVDLRQHQHRHHQPHKLKLHMYLNLFYPRSLMQRLSLLGKKVNATLKSAWTEKDQINDLLKESRLMRSLEKFVGGKLFEGDLRLRQKIHMILSYVVLILKRYQSDSFTMKMEICLSQHHTKLNLLMDLLSHLGYTVGRDDIINIVSLRKHSTLNGRIILASIEKGPLDWPSITMDGVTRLKEYTELTPAEAIQADCDIKTINIILQGLPTEIYALQERECKLYNEFDKFTYNKGESLHEYYLRFTLLLNDMNIYKMPLEQFQVNTKFLNTLLDEWSKFITDVKLVRDLHTANVDQLHAYLEQHERHANEVRLMHERNSDPLALVASHQITSIF
ncbi:hypothetical protein Tco_0047060 [Tanacetum coccineum]